MSGNLLVQVAHEQIQCATLMHVAFPIFKCICSFLMCSFLTHVEQCWPCSRAEAAAAAERGESAAEAARAAAKEAERGKRAAERKLVSPCECGGSRMDGYRTDYGGHKVYGLLGAPRLAPYSPCLSCGKTFALGPSSSPTTHLQKPTLVTGPAHFLTVSFPCGPTYSTVLIHDSPCKCNLLQK